MKKKLMALVLVLTLLTGCLLTGQAEDLWDEEIPGVTGLDWDYDAETLQYIEDMTLATFEEKGLSGCRILSVAAMQVSAEYLRNVLNNSRANIFFGYTLEEVEQMYEGHPFYFTLGENLQTVVRLQSEEIDLRRILTNLAIGASVILVCVTVECLTAAAPSATMQMIHVIASGARKKAIKSAVTGAITGEATAAVIRYLYTGEWEPGDALVLESAAESFAWGAITGAVKGGVKAVTAPLGGAVLGTVAGAAAGKMIRKPYESISAVRERYGSMEPMSFMGGQVVSDGTEGAFRPDALVLKDNGIWEAIRVKNYDLADVTLFASLIADLVRGAKAAAENLPAGSLQRIVLDIRGRGYQESFLKETVQKISSTLDAVIPGIVIELLE